MRKLMFVAILLISVLSCSKDNEEKDPIFTSYHVVNNLEKQESPIDYLDGTLYEVVVYCFDNVGDVVNEDYLAPINSGGGKSDEIYVSDDVVKLVVSFKLLPRESPLYDMDENVRKYTVTRFVLTEGMDNEIAITGNTTIGNTLLKVENTDIPIGRFLEMIH